MMLWKHNGPVLPAAIIFILLLTGPLCRAQILAPDIPQNKPLLLVEEQYKEGHYAQAVQSARQYLETRDGTMPDREANDADKVKYYMAMSYIKADLPGGKDSAIAMLNATANPAYKQRLSFALAQYYFQHNELAKAVPLYTQAGTDNLDEGEKADAKFELAYCYFNNRQFDRAEPLLADIKELKDGKYYMAGNYYYGLIEYNKNKYSEALTSFDRVKDAKDYKSVVPYYIAEIYYFMGSRDKALKLAISLITGRDRSYYDKELHLLAAQCLFEEQKYKEAHPYFDFYYDHTDKIRKQDLYEMAYCDYRLSEWASAIEKFKLLNSASDSLGQTAMYLLGDCYLKTYDKPSARNAFGICADMTYNKGQQEASMILYARISYETGYNDEALRQLYALLKAFPASQYKDEANTMISGLLVKTNNYAEALKHLGAVTNKEGDYWAVYQKASFGYAIEEYRKGNLERARNYFDQSIEHPVNKVYETAVYFWKGEIAYRLHDYADVITYSQEFVSRAGKNRGVASVSPQATVQHAYLNMGYAAMATENYMSAQNYFNHAQDEVGDNYSGMVAAVRAADAVFMQKNYTKAIALYETIIVTDTMDADYARYQKAILLGLTGRNSEKATLLQTLISKAPPSAYANFARYELALTYLEGDKYQPALVVLKQLTDSVSDKSFAPKSWMKLGFIYQQTDRTELAIEAYKHVLIDYPSSEDRLSALDALKGLYIQSNQPAAYTRLLRENNLPSADSSSIDSTYYAAAETQYSNGKMESARDGFSNYLRQYPHGIFAVKAYYYRGECNFHLKNYKDAKADYNVILSGPWNEFYENSARHAATIAYEDRDFAAAYGYYRKLADNTTSSQTREQAFNGLVKSGFYSGKYAETALYADTLMALPGVSEETSNEALYFKARSLQLTDSVSDEAVAMYKQLSKNKNGEMAAEARYEIADILYKQGKLKEAEDAANETIHLSAGYEKWTSKAYLLLADVLVKQKDYFNAKALLQSIVKHTKLADMKAEASVKLEEVKKLEKQQSKLSEE